MTAALELDDRSDANVGDALAFAQAVAEDLELIAILHDREPTEALIEAMRACPFEQQLAIVPSDPDTVNALAALKLSLDDLPSPIDSRALDDLAAGFADVYLRHTYRASPEESVWLTEDGLQRQGPMFAIREIYRRNNLRVTDWASRPDDHIVLQLRFLAHLLRAARHTGDLALPATFLDEHLLLWVKPFAARLIDCRAPDYYCAIALLTATYLHELRATLAEITGIAVPVAKRLEATTLPDAAALEKPYFPGMAPSW